MKGADLRFEAFAFVVYAGSTLFLLTLGSYALLIGQYLVAPGLICLALLVVFVASDLIDRRAARF